MNYRPLILTLSITALLSGCAITKEVKPVPNRISSICLERNNDTFMDDYHGTLESELTKIGIQTKSIWPSEEKDCQTVMKYHAEWQWDLAMYLSLATFSVYKSEDLIGYGKYEPGRFSFNLNKFGSNEGKIDPILRELFKNN